MWPRIYEKRIITGTFHFAQNVHPNTFKIRNLSTILKWSKTESENIVALFVLETPNQ